MNSVIQIKSHTAPSVNKKEILRYAKGGDDIKTVELLEECLAECEQIFSYKTCHRIFNLEINGTTCDFGEFKVNSRDLAKNLNGCKRVAIFGATLGVGIDRLILKYSKISPSKAIMLQSIGAERVEALCELFCKELQAEYGVLTRPRFSAGYGDLSLIIQKDIFLLLQLEKNLGVTLGESLLMSPTKSVTAFVGLC